MVITGNYTKQFTLANPLTVDKNLSMANGELTTTQTGGLTLKNVPAGSEIVNTWTGGTIDGSGTVTVQAGDSTNDPATLVIETGVNLNQTYVYDDGAIRWVSGTVGTNGGRIDINGTFTAESDDRMTYTGPVGGDMGGVMVDTYGTFEKKLAQTGKTEIDIPFNVSSVVNPAVKVTQGELELDGGGTSSGVFQVATGTDLYFSGGQYACEQGTQFKGPGATTVAGDGTMYLAGADVPADYFQLSGTLNGNGNLIINTTFNLYSGVMDGTVNGGPGTITIQAGAKMEVGPAGAGAVLPYSTQWTIDNYGTIDINSTSSWRVDNGTIINNNGSFYFNDDGSVKQLSGPAVSQFNNTGLCQKWAGNGISKLYMNYKSSGNGKLDQRSGTIELPKVIILGGTCEVDGGDIVVDGDFEQDAGSTVVYDPNTLSIQGNVIMNGGTLSMSGGSISATTVQVASGAILSGVGTITADVTSGGEVDVTAAAPGTLAVTGAYSQGGGTTTVYSGQTLNVSDTLTESGGTIQLQGGSIGATNGLEIYNGAVLSGVGTITADVTSSGEVDVTADSPGTLAVVGNYSQEEGSTTNVYSGQTLTVSGALTEVASYIRLFRD